MGKIACASHRLAPVGSWRQEPYELISNRPAIDLLTGNSVFRQALDAGNDYLIALAAARGALLVTGDSDLLALHESAPIRSPREALETLALGCCPHADEEHR